MTNAQLKELAKENNVHIPSDANKEEMIAILQDAGVQIPENGNGEGEGKSPQLMAAPTEEHAEVMPMALTGPVTTLPLAGIIADAYGIGRKYNIALSDIQLLGAVLQGNILLDNLPAGAIMQLTRVKHSQAAAGPSVTACTAQVGDGTNNWGAALDIFQAPSNTALNTGQLTANNIGPFNTVYPVYLTLIAVGGNLGVFTAGALSVWLRWTILE